MLQEQLGIARRNLALQDSTLRIMRLQHDAGQVSLLAVQQAEVQKETTAALIPELEQALMTQENRSEEHTSELQSLMSISYAVFCLKQKKIQHVSQQTNN